MTVKHRLHDPGTLLLAALVWASAAFLSAPRVAEAQDIPAGLLGGALGLGAGGLVSVGIWTLKARHSEYLYSVDDALGWEAAPVLIGLGVGTAIGLSNSQRLEHTVIGGVGAGLVGTGVGVLVGSSLWEPPEGRWAGGVIGAAAGVLAGSIAGALWPIDEEGAEEARSGVPVTLRIPVAF